MNKRSYLSFNQQEGTVDISSVIYNCFPSSETQMQFYKFSVHVTGIILFQCYFDM